MILRNLLKKQSYFWLLFLLCIQSFAQESEINANALATYNHALKLYNSKAYAAAQLNFKQAANLAENSETILADADYYDALCAIKLHQTDADKKVTDFVENHPNSNKKEKAYLNVGNHYFANKNAAYALKWYQKVNSSLLSVDDKKELDFKMGYALLVAKYFDDAKKKFITLLNDPRYGDDSRYYYGYIAYKQEDYDIAEATLAEIADKQAYNAEVTYYLLDISFKAGRFERCIEVGKKLLEKKDQKEKSDINKIIGESYFNLKKYADAIPYLLEYKGKRRKWNNTDYYQLGYAYYQQKDYVKAIANFNKIIDQPNAVSQNAYYHLAECYINLDKKPEALNAFKSASEMSFNLKIKEDAALNYAKLSYEEGNPYKSVPEVLQDYLKAYPKSTHYNEVNQLVVTSYIHQEDYIGALKYLDDNKSSENIELTKEVSFYRGIQLFTQNQLQKAYPFFVTATQSNESTIKERAKYWQAETDYRLGNYQKSLDEFIAFKKNSNATKVDEYKLIDYNLGYALFKLKKYSDSSKSFQNFINTKNDSQELLDDAAIRQGDCFFGIKNYTKAIIAYDNVISNYGVGSDYAQYQKSMSLGFLSKNDEKAIQLTKIANEYPESNFKDDALYQLGNTYALLKDNFKAHAAYNRLKEKHPKSSYVPGVLLRQGLLFYNDNKNDKAIAKYKEVTTKYPYSNEAKQAVTNARNVYVDLGNIDEYATWVKGLGFVNISDEEVENTMFESAENKFLEGDTKKAIKGFEKYVRKFPKGTHILKANFHLAQLLDKDGKKEEAAKNYEYIVKQNQNEYSEESLNRLAQFYLERENWNAAMPLLSRLELEANYPQNIVFAQRNLMKGYYESDQFEKAVEYAEKVLNGEKLEAAIENDAKIIVARAAFKTNDFNKAEEFYTEVSKNATGELKAESLYYDAYFKHQNKEYSESNKVIQNLIAKYSNYKYWGVKSYVIMAKNYYKLKDAYQATYILENIIKNFKQYKDIIKEANDELVKIKNNEAKTNESVTPKN